MRRSVRLPALGLTFAILCTTSAQALTPDQARDLLTQYYIDEVPQPVLDQDTIEQMLEVLGDPYTQYFSPEQYNIFTSSMEDSQLVGVGGSFTLAKDGLLTVRIFPGSAAEQAGLQEGDLITAADGQPLAGLSLDQAGMVLRGTEGTTLSITYLRDGVSSTVTLTRTPFLVPTAYTEIWEGRIGYLDCDTFGADTLTHFLEDLSRHDATVSGWMVDLRDNPGGDYSAAMGTIGCFTGQDTRSYLRDGMGQYAAYGTGVDKQTTHPLLVLTNAGSASASELFAASIRDTGSGLLVGERTYGKGVAQTVLDQNSFPAYFPDGDAMKITTFRFYGPSGATNDTIGVIPHLLLDASLADEVGTLLLGEPPAESSAQYLRLELAGVWYLSLDQALTAEYRPAFVSLLEALPEGAVLQQGSAEGWAAVSPADLARELALTEYTPRGFADTSSSPYEAQIQHLAAYDMLRGTGEKSYQPTAPLTRAQLCSLLAQVLNCKTPAGTSTFSDVSMEDWYGPAVHALASMGLVNGTGGSLFEPDAPISHEQFITIMSRLAKRLSMAMDLTWQDRPDTAGDSFSHWSDWAREEAWLLSQSQTGLLNNTVNLLWMAPEQIDPAAVTTREEAAALTYSLLYWIGILPEIS